MAENAEDKYVPSEEVEEILDGLRLMDDTFIRKRKEDENICVRQ